MKKILKLMITATLLLAGILASFAKDVNTSASTETNTLAEQRKKLGEKDYKELIQKIDQKTVGELTTTIKEKLEDDQQLSDIVDRIKEKNPALANEVHEFLIKNEGTKIHDLDLNKTKIKNVIENVSNKIREHFAKTPDTNNEKNADVVN